MSSEGWSSQVAFHLVERACPTGAVAVARGLVEELLVQQREQRALAVGRQRDRYQRLPLRHGAPHPGEDELPVGDHLTIGAADVMLLAIRRAEDDVEATADAHVQLCAQRLCLLGAPPVRYFC